jgi:phosphatidylglycerophosphatase A
VLLLGTWAAERAERLIGGKDPGAIVVDEVAGMTISVLLVPRTIAALAVAFLLFRVFDIVKPFPARQSQRIRGGVGVMIDDVIAGLYALALMALLRALVRWP